MKLSFRKVVVRTRHPFIIARGGASEWELVWVKVVNSDGVEGFGEAAPSAYYGETADTVIAALERIRAIVENAGGASLESIERDMEQSIRHNAAARCAVSAALHDLEGKVLGVPLWRLWGLEPARAPASSFTIGIPASMDDLPARILEAEEYPILKVKLGSAREQEIIRRVRELAPGKVLRVDANAAWTARHALHMIDLLHDLDVELVEQPLPAHDIEGMRFVRERSPLPIMADESCVTAADVPRLAGAVDGVNLKLAKCGSLREALRIVNVARAHSMLVMAGCMIESSLGITAAAHLAPLLDYADLDGAALLANDPAAGAGIQGGVISIPSEPGLGVSFR